MKILEVNLEVVVCGNVLEFDIYICFKYCQILLNFSSVMMKKSYVLVGV